MTTHFITAEIEIQATPDKLKQEIETQLAKQGKPLRWAITQVDTARQKVAVEAIVTKDSE
jgi:hypothetical protein